MAAMVAILAYWSKQFKLFRSTSNPNASNQVSSQMAFQFRRRSEK